jgi:hypothetical protein
VRVLPPEEFVAYLQVLLAVGRVAMALTHLYDQFMEHLDQSGRDMPRLKVIVGIILEKVTNFGFLHGMCFFLRTPARDAEPQELISMIKRYYHKKMYDALFDPKAKEAPT